MHRFDQRLPEEIELEQKLQELEALRAQHAEAQRSLEKLEEEIARFAKLYQRTLGRRIDELERLEREIATLTGFYDPSCGWEECSSDAGTGSSSPQEESGRSGGTATASEYGEETFTFGKGINAGRKKERGERAEERDIKALYREVAKAIHPDLAACDTGRAQRHKLMSEANQAYAEEDHRKLKSILRDWQLSTEAVDGNDVASELVRVIRLIARERQEIEAAQAKIEELKESYLCRLKLRVDGNFSRGSDLFADLMAAADINIAKARRRLATLKGEQEQEVVKKQQNKPTRSVIFPTVAPCGTLYTRDRGSANFSQWQKVGAASGVVEVDLEKALRLDVKEDTAVRLGSLRELQAEDLQALFLYGVSDEELDHVLHLTGLEELYLSGPGFTDLALSGMASLANVKRLYLYQTKITDQGLQQLKKLNALQGLTCSGNEVTQEGLAALELAIPGLRAVNIPWRR